MAGQSRFDIIVNVAAQGALAQTKRVESGLDRINRKASRTNNLNVNASRANRSIRSVNTNIDRLRGGISELERNFRRLLVGVATVAVVFRGFQGITNLLDQVTDLRNRLRLVVDDTQLLNQNVRDLFDIANQSRTAFDAVGNLFTRTALSARELGRSRAELLRFTETLSRLTILSGATPQEASGGLRQFTQAIASNRLAGDEFRSVSENLPAVTEAIAEFLGVTRGELRQLSIDGALTAQVLVDSILSVADRVEDQFESTTVTIGQSFVVLLNNIQEFGDRINTTTGFTEGFAEVMLGLANNVDIVANILLLTTGIIVARYIPGILATIQTFRAFRFGLTQFAHTSLLVDQGFTRLIHRNTLYRDSTTALARQLGQSGLGRILIRLSGLWNRVTRALVPLTFGVRLLIRLLGPIGFGATVAALVVGLVNLTNAQKDFNDGLNVNNAIARQAINNSKSYLQPLNDIATAYREYVDQLEREHELRSSAEFQGPGGPFGGLTFLGGGSVGPGFRRPLPDDPRIALGPTGVISGEGTNPVFSQGEDAFVSGERDRIARAIERLLSEDVVTPRGYSTLEEFNRNFRAIFSPGQQESIGRALSTGNVNDSLVTPELLQRVFERRGQLSARDAIERQGLNFRAYRAIFTQDEEEDETRRTRRGSGAFQGPLALRFSIIENSLLSVSDSVFSQIETGLIELGRTGDITFRELGKSLADSLISTGIGGIGAAFRGFLTGEGVTSLSESGGGFIGGLGRSIGSFLGLGGAANGGRIIAPGGPTDSVRLSALVSGGEEITFRNRAQQRVGAGGGGPINLNVYYNPRALDRYNRSPRGRQVQLQTYSEHQRGFGR